MTFAKLQKVQVSQATSGVIVAAVAGKRIHVYGCVLQSAGGTSALEDDSGNTLGALNISAAPFVLPRDGDPYLTCDAGDALNLTISATDANVGTVWYSQS